MDRSIDSDIILQLDGVDPEIIRKLNSIGPDTIRKMYNVDPNLFRKLNAIDPETILKLYNIDPEIIRVLYGIDPEIIHKLDNLTQLQRLSPKGRMDIVTLLALLLGEYGVNLSISQAEMFISHLTETFRRIEQGEPLELMAATTAGQIRSFDGSGIVDQMMQDFCRITDNHFPHSEEEYLKMYLSTFL